MELNDQLHFASQYLLDMELRGPESQSGHCGKYRYLNPTKIGLYFSVVQSVS
jgi:hypothetical protein